MCFIVKIILHRIYLWNNNVHFYERIYLVLHPRWCTIVIQSSKKENAGKSMCSVYTMLENNALSRRCKYLLILLKRGERKRARIARSEAILIYSRYIRHRKAFYQRDGARFYSGVLIDDSLPSPSASGFPGRSQRGLIYHVVLIIEPKPMREHG